MSKKKMILLALGVVVIITLLMGVDYYRKHFYKENRLAEFLSPAGHQVYILGTCHGMHFDKGLNYSMEDVMSCIENVNPDIVLIESKADTYEEHGVLDGPIDMILVYSYCKQNNIPVEMIDWWVVDNDFQTNTTDEERDDHIYENINNQLAKVDEPVRVMIVCGDAHVPEQSARMRRDGWVKNSIKDRSSYFQSQDAEFTYPSIMAEVVEDKIDYLCDDFQVILEESINDVDVKKAAHKSIDALIEALKVQLEIIKENKLYQ